MNELTKKQEAFKSKLVDKLQELPMLPTVVVRLMALDHNDENYQNDIIDLVRQDPTFAARVIQLANSAYSHPVSPVTTLRDAVIRVGSDRTSSLVTSLGVIKVFTPTSQGQKNLWIHAIQTAVTAEEITKLSSDDVISPNEAYVAGLMHDIGRFIMFSDSPDELNVVEDHHWENLETLIQLELDICGYDHAELGWHACKKWHIPSLVTNIVKHHHHYKLSDADRPERVVIGKILRIIQLADRFSVLMMTMPEFSSLKQTEVRQLINEHCSVPSWPEMPISVEELAENSALIVKLSESSVEKLGL